jgi:hypothetical protein
MDHKTKIISLKAKKKNIDLKKIKGEKNC